jgi:hypothetical protein
MFVHVLLPIVLATLVVIEMVVNKIKYNWNTLIFMFAIPAIYHLFLLWWTPQYGDYWPYEYLNPLVIGWDELAVRYTIIVAGFHLIGIEIWLMSNIRRKLW